MARQKWTFLGERVKTPVDITPNIDESILELAGKRQSPVYGEGHRWELTFDLSDPRSYRKLGAKIAAHQDGHLRKKTFTAKMPQHVGNAIVEGDVSVRENVVAGSEQIKLKTASGRVVIPLAYFVGFTGHSKIYRVRSAATITTTAGTITVSPTLRADLTTANKLLLDPDITLKWGNKGVYGTTYENGTGYANTFQVIEAV